MLKNFTILLSAILIASTAAQAASKPSQDDLKRVFTSPIFGKVYDLGMPHANALLFVERISKAIGFKKEITVISARIERYATAFAARRDGRFFIVYDRNHRDWVRGSPSLADARVFGHEVGHFLSDFLTGFRKQYTGHDEEFRADMFAGFAMARMGFTLAQTTSGIGDWAATKHHPAGLERKGVIEEGWRLGNLVNSFIPEPKVCKPGFTTPEFEVDYSICRIVRQCSNNEPVHRLSCKGLDGNWTWKE